MPDYEAKLEAARKRFDEEIAVIAGEVFHDIVVPLCQKYDLEFLSGNSDFWFVPPEDGDSEDRDVLRDHHDAYNEGYDEDEFREVFKILNTMADHRQTIGELLDCLCRDEES